MNSPERVTSHAALGHILREARGRQRLSQERLAAAAGVARRVVINAESGKSITTDNLLRILQGLSLELLVQPRRRAAAFDNDELTARG